ncbi:hypothetical protein DEI95_16145 [Curtobacterium sp. MCBD17_008]|nr:hypothetical protein DEI95_16145 [Curtobacterium sp. MCBD17_008]
MRFWGAIELTCAGLLLILAIVGLIAQASYGWAALILCLLFGLAGGSFLSIAGSTKTPAR